MMISARRAAAGRIGKRVPRNRPRHPRRNRTERLCDWRVDWRGIESLEPRLLMSGDHGNADPPAHPDDPAKQAEHEALLDLVPHDAATHVAEADGRWSDPLIWRDGLIPSANSDVLIPDDIDVTFDLILTDPLHTVRVDGDLFFSVQQDTQMMVDTFVVSSIGRLHVGSIDQPVPLDVTATIVIADTGPIDTQWDPTLLSRGLISHGALEMYGGDVTPFVALSDVPQQGDTQLTLSAEPVNWRVGDQLVVTGTSPTQNTDEQLTILAIDGPMVTVEPLQFTQQVPSADADVYVANLSRNVVVMSENVDDNDRRGHVMFMHSPNVDVHNVGFYGLGRTDKRTHIDDPVLDDDGHLIEGTGLNVRGRYAAHFHRNGDDIHGDPAAITGSVVADSPGWGYVNHDSHVVMQDNIAYDVVGAGFVTENGTEVGRFEGNLAVRSEGSGDALRSRKQIHDFGHGGHGFWFQGAGIEVVNNIASGHRGGAFVYFTSNKNVEFLAANLADPAMAQGAESVPVGDVPIRRFEGNTAFASMFGVETWFHLLEADHGQRSVIADSTFWNVVGHGGRIHYTAHLTLRDTVFAAGTGEVSATGVHPNTVTHHIRYENLYSHKLL